MKATEIRSRFLEFFRTNGHQVVRSSSLVPERDPTLLFTNAGMNQFKDVFLGAEKRAYTRAATSQKCVRAGGKHNDLENVGYTNRHLTFFEMLGNFSFGDYFKEDAIKLAWSLLTDGYKLPKDDLYATVFTEDDEAYALWREKVGLPEGRVSRLGAKDNFWAMGDTGPCGPCSEIYVDTKINGCGKAGCAPGCDCERFVEIWNLVFMQFDRDKSGKMTPLPAPSIDTGMGLERLSMFLQGVNTIFETDLLRPLIDRTAERAGTRYGADEFGDTALRVVADHLRSTTFLIADGVLPSNEGRGYVLRRILRRALRFGKRLGLEKPFLSELTGAVVENMGSAYPELVESRDKIREIVADEEDRFDRALAVSGKLFEEIVTGLEGKGERVIPGGEAFRLYDTFGLPIDTLRDMAEARGLKVDDAGFDARLEQARAEARATWKGGSQRAVSDVVRGLAAAGESAFLGYETTELLEARVRAMLKGQVEVQAAAEGDEVDLLLDRTPFYPEGGGQVGDRGTIASEGGFFRVEDTVRPVPGLILHRGKVTRGTLRPGDVVTVTVEKSRRRATALNHSATHLLHAALRAQLGEHVKQAGSLVEPSRLRFDFSHYRKIEPESLAAIEALVNARVSADDHVETKVVAIEDALKAGAMAFFGDKYGDEVRTVRMGDFSLELCGGTHAASTGNLNYFAIVSESGVSSGVRRIEAVTGDAAVVRAFHDRSLLEEVAGRFHVPTGALLEHVEGLARDLKASQREIAELKLKLASAGPGGGAGGDDGIREVEGVPVAVRRVEGLDSGGMRNLADELKKKVKSGVVVLGAVRDGKAALLVAVTPDLADRVDAGGVVKELAALVGGTGGGRKDMAQAGGPDADKLGEALERSVDIVARRLRPAAG